MKINKKNITEKAANLISELGYLYIETSFRGTDNNSVIEIFVDSEKGITTVNCAEISHAIGELFETEELVSSKFRLDISSPGIDRPLKFLQQFPRNINRKFELRIKENDAIKKTTAKLVSVEGSILNFDEGKNVFSVDFENIASAKVLISF